MSSLRFANLFRLEDRPHPDPEIRLALARQFVHREQRLHYSAVGIGVVLMVTGLAIDLPWLFAMGLVRATVDSFGQSLLRKLSNSLDSSGDTGVGATERLLRGLERFYALTGVTWGCLTGSSIVGLNASPVLAMPAAISIVATVMLTTSTCHVPRLFTSFHAAYMLSLLPFCVALGGTERLILLGGLPVLQYLNWDLARGTLRQLTSMLEMQFERDRALERQSQVIAELDAARSHAQQLAQTDSVTQIPNRQAFLDQVDARVANPAQPFVLILLDLDHFKNINDTMGHHVGDAVLTGMAQALLQIEAGRSGPASLPFIARLGGDELAVVLPGAQSPDSVAERFDRWRQQLAQLPVDGVGSVALSFTAGSARFPLDGAERRALLNAADMAMRAAKAACRGTHQSYRPEMNAEFLRETRIAQLLSQAIDERHLEIVIQPQVRMSDGAIVAGEALTRFNQAELGGYSVQAVFDVAEERGLGRRLAAVLMEVSGDAAKWLQQQPCAVPIAINLSPSTLKAPAALLEQLETWLSQGLRRDLVKLEITEDAISGRGLGHIEAMFARIARLGFAVSLDDFGTGHASLAHLHTLPINELKIARQFVESVCHNRKDQAIVRSALAMCEHLSIRCVVEGVENAEQVRMLQALGATVGQGYHWHRPMNLHDFCELLATDKAMATLDAPGLTT